MRKLFHRKKHDDASSSPNHSSPHSDGNASRLPTSPYHTLPAGGRPHTGDYPIKGNDTANVLKKKPSRRSSVRSWRSSSGSQQPAFTNTSPPPDQYGPAASASPPKSNVMAAEPYAPQPGGQNRWSRTQLPQEFARLDLGNEGQPPPTFTTTTTTTTTGPVTTIHSSRSVSGGAGPANLKPARSRAQQRQGPTDVNASSIRPVNPSTMQESNPSPEPQTQSSSKYGATPSDMEEAYPRNVPPVAAVEPQSSSPLPVHGKQPRQRDYDGPGPAHSSSILRKEVGTNSTNAPRQFSAASPSKTDNYRRLSGDKTLPPGPRASHDGPTSRGVEPAPAPAAWSVLDTKGVHSQDRNLPDAQSVVDKAKTTTSDTSIIEKSAPAVVHETVHKDVHHVREELIRREIHNHDIYHRIQPVIDVEVLPARHFLPVEGGGLVEVHADEVPGRHNHWVLAETVSQIPSDQAAPVGATDFTARKFPGREGDEMKYVAPEGHEKTEQTWVHPPELETGARDTGQSWPMVFGEAAPKEGTYGYKSPGKSKSRSSKQAGMTSGSTR